MKKAKRVKIQKWEPPHKFYKSLGELEEEAKLSLEPIVFETDLRKYLKEQNFQHDVSPAMVKRLFRKTQSCLKRLDAVEKFRPVVESPDWKRARKILRRLVEKGLQGLLSRLKKDKDPDLPLTSNLVDIVSGRIEELREEFYWIERFATNDEKLVTAYLRPELESQFMCEIDDYLAHQFPSVGVGKRRLIIEGCVKAGQDVAGPIH